MTSRGPDARTEREYLERLRLLWQRNWPPDAPREARYPFGEVPLTDYLRQRAQRTPEKPAVIFYGAELSFGELDRQSDRFARFLASRGFQKGDRVAMMLPNCPQFHVVFFGTLKRGCIHVPVNPLFKEEEFVYEVNEADAEIIVVLDQLFPLVSMARGPS